MPKKKKDNNPFAIFSFEKLTLTLGTYSKLHIFHIPDFSCTFTVAVYGRGLLFPLRRCSASKEIIFYSLNPFLLTTFLDAFWLRNTGETH